MEDKKLPENKNTAFFARILVAVICVALLVGVVLVGFNRLYAPKIPFSISGGFTAERNNKILELVEKYKQEQGFSFRLMELQESIEELPWVQSARIRLGVNRHLIDIERFVPVARLNDRWFLSYSGKRKDIIDETGYTNLVSYQFDQEQQITILPKVQNIQEQLTSLDLTITKLEVSLSGNWSVGVDSGMTIHLGIDNLDEKITRLGRLLPDILKKGKPIRIDLRNAFGIAVAYEKTSEE